MSFPTFSPRTTLFAILLASFLAALSISIKMTASSSLSLSASWMLLLFPLAIFLAFLFFGLLLFLISIFAPQRYKKILPYLSIGKKADAQALKRDLRKTKKAKKAAMLGPISKVHIHAD